MKMKLKYLFIPLLIVIITGGVILFKTYNSLYQPVHQQNESFIYVTNETTINTIAKQLDTLGYNINSTLFNYFCELKKFQPSNKEGLYNITNLSVNQIVNKIRIGDQDAIDFTFISTRNIGDIIENAVNSFSKIDSIKMDSLLNNKEFLKSLGFNRETIPAIFIPNTYKMYWTTSEIPFFERMKREFQDFWNDERSAKAKKLNLTPIQVATLASIIDEESSYTPEYRRIAGVYLNRLKRGMKLEADPTLKFANGDFSTKRVLNKDKLIDSPYNTYMYAGLPPGPIRVPSIQAIDAVLNAENHSFIFFCANSDFSGKHVFAKTLREHNNNANKYRKALQQRKIYR